MEAQKKKEKRVHQRRVRRSQEGELVQADGSYHDWFEGRAPKCCLIQFVDDATSKILYAKFCEWESKNNYFACLEGCLKKHGKPQGLYVDKHSVFRVNRKESKKGKGVTAFHKALPSLPTQNEDPKQNEIQESDDHRKARERADHRISGKRDPLYSMGRAQIYGTRGHR